MALEERVFDLPMRAGLVEAERPEVLDPSAGFSRVENLIQDKTGSLVKRPGSTNLGRALVEGGTLATDSIRRLVVAGDDGPCVIAEASAGATGAHMFAWSETAQAWARRDRVPEVGATRRPGVQPGSRFNVAYEIVARGQYRVVTYSTTLAGPSATLYAVVIDTATGAPVRGPELIATNVGAINYTPSVLVAVGNVVVCVYDTWDGILRAKTIDTTSAATINTGWSAATALTAVGEYNTTGWWDACSMSDRFFLAFDDTAPDVTVRSFTSALVQIATQPTVGLQPINIAIAVAEGDTLWIAYQPFGVPNTIIVGGLNPTNLAVTLAAFNIITNTAVWGGATGIHVMSVQPTTAGKGHLIACRDSFGRDLAIMFVRQFQTTAGACATDGAQRVYFRAAMFTKPWRINSRVYVGVNSGSVQTTEAAMLLHRYPVNYAVDVTDEEDSLRAVATLAPGLLTNAFAIGRPHGVAVSGSVVEYLIPVAKHGGQTPSTQAPALEIARIDHGATNRWQPVDMNAAVHLSGGVASYYDGSRVHEMNFIQAPEIGTISQAGAAGLADGFYSYTAIFEQVDAAGNIHWSAPAPPKLFEVTGGPRTVTINVSTLTFTARMDAEDFTSPVRVVLLRSQVNGDGTYYRAQVTDNTNAGLVVFTDTTQDLSANPIPYTLPGTVGTALPRRAPPSLSCLTQHGDSLVGVADDGSLWFTGAAIPGEGLWFNSLMSVYIPDPARPTALASFDGRLYVFMAQRIWALSGPGYADNGGGGYSPPERIAVDSGCVDPRSVAVTPLGCFFQSDLGIMLLSRSGEVGWIGEPVRDTLATYPVITSAVYDSGASRVVFSCVASETYPYTADVACAQIVYDLATRTWSTFLHPTDSDQTTRSAALATRSGFPVLHWADGYVVRHENAAASYDIEPSGPGNVQTFVASVLETPWIKLAGLQGFQRLWSVLLLLRRLTDHAITVSIAFDYATAYTETYSFTAAEIAALPREQLEIRPKRRECQAIRIKLEDAAGGTLSTGLASEILGFRFHYGVERKNALPSTHRTVTP